MTDLPPITPASLVAVDERLAEGRRLGHRWARLDDAEALARALRAAWDRYPPSRPPDVPPHLASPRSLESAFDGYQWRVDRAHATVVKAGGDVAVAAARLGVDPRELTRFMDTYYPGWR